VGLYTRIFCLLDKNYINQNSDTAWNMWIEAKQKYNGFLLFQMFDQIWTFLIWLFDYSLAIIRTLPRDLYGLGKLLRHSFLIKYYIYRKRDYISIFRDNVKYYKSKPCFIFEDTSLSFQQVCLFRIIKYVYFFIFLGWRFNKSISKFFSSWRLFSWWCYCTCIR